MKATSAIGGFLLLAVAVGCDRDCFQIEVRPDGQAFHRKLTCWRLGGKDSKEVQPLRPEELTRIGALYAKRETAEDGKKHVFSGRFTGKTPGDVGGAGSYAHFVSPMGATSWYVERFRGNDDLEVQLAERRKAAEQLSGLLAGWLDVELRGDANRGRLVKFLTDALRRDLTNIGLYEWTGRIAGAERNEFNADPLARIGLYLHERGYLSSNQVPALARSLANEDARPALALLQRFLASKMGVADNQPIPASLGFLDDPAKVQASFDNYVKTTRLFQERAAQWKAKKAADPDFNAEEPTPGQVAGQLLAAAIGNFGILAGRGDSLEMKLFCGQKPYATSGKWDEKLAAVAWNTSLASDLALPLVCFAAWSEPDRAFQEKHFGAVVLDEAGLAQYAVWYLSLTTGETQEWDRFVNGLKPGSELKTAIESFRFAAESRDAGGAKSSVPRELLLKRLP